MSGENQKKITAGSYIWKILHLTREYYPLIFVYAIFINLLTLTVPISVKAMVNTFSFGPYLKPLFTLSLLLFGFLALLGLFQSLQYLLTEQLQLRTHAKLTANIMRSIILRNEEKQDDMRYLYMANRYFDVVLIQKLASSLVIEGFSVALQTIFGLVLISIYHPLFIILGLVIILSITIVLWVYGKESLRTAVVESTSKYDAADFIEGLAVTHIDPEDIEKKFQEADSWISHYLIARKKHFKLLFQQNIYFVCCFAIFNALLLGLGGYLVIVNQLSIGELVATEIIANSLFYHLLSARKYIEPFLDLYAAAGKVGGFEKIQQLRLEDFDIELSPGAKKYIQSSESQFHQKLQSVRSVFYPKNYSKILKRFALGLVLIALILIYVPWQQTSIGEGRIIALDPNDRAQQITAPVNGRIQKWLVQDGEFVKEGQPIVEIIDNDPNFIIRLQAEKDAAQKQLDAAEAASDTAKLNLNRTEALAKEGLSSTKEFEQAKIKYKELLAKQAGAAAKLASAETKLSRQRTQSVKAPRDGQILHLLHGSGSVYIKSGQALLSFVPSPKQLAAEIWVDGNDLPLVYPGRIVRLQFEGWPAVQFKGFPKINIGSFGGKVHIVDPFVNEKGYFRIVVVPDKNSKDSWPEHTLLRQGTRVYAITLLNEVPLGYETWRLLNGFPKSMNEEVANKYYGGKSDAKKK